MNAGEIVDLVIAIGVWIFSGVMLLVLVASKSILDRYPPEKRELLLAWREKYGKIAWIVGPCLLAMGIYHIAAIVWHH